MDFTFSEEQDALRASVRAVVSDQAAAGVVRAAIGGDWCVEADLWGRMHDLGWSAMLVPEALGGLGLTLVDAVVVLEETGRATLPGPFLSSAVIATTAAMLLGADDLLTQLASSRARGTVALEEAGHDDPVGRVRTLAERKGAGWVLTGEKPIVLDADAEWVIVAARTQLGLGSFLIEEPVIERNAALDPTRSTGRLSLNATPATPIGPAGDHTAIWGDISDVAAVALAAELIGVCDATFAMAIAYAQERVQFDVPLASHQVTQHKFVDMLHRFELGRVGVHRAAWAIDVHDENRAQSSAIAKSVMGEAAVYVTAENIQIHGAVGFTWASDAHLFYKRAKQNDALYGARAWHERRVADLVLGA